MTLSDAIDWIKYVSSFTDWCSEDIVEGEDGPETAEAIATILNAIVKGELK